MLGALLMGSGLIGAGHGRPLSWITYIGAYYVVYLLKIVMGGMQCYLGQQVYDVATMAAGCPAMPLGLEQIADYLGFHPPLGSPRLAAAAGVRALQVFMRLKYVELGGDVRKYRGLLKGLH